MAQIPQLLAEYISLLPPKRSERIQALHNDTASQKNYISLYTCYTCYTCAREYIQAYLNLHPKTRCGTGCLNFHDRIYKGRSE
ncbi:hypothetical protein [Microbulbifer sp. CAU 1566]|uniref:hypothetical protein n=1 Tax=Microbulbifer sp. CAU 1566 TaxID=2933269 RepID=UPI002002E8C3|nr:hypothetical protein [Microbulbifer sp. CAU 1566]